MSAIIGQDTFQKFMLKASIDSKQGYDTKYLFIDGLSGSGNGGIAPIVSSLTKVEYHRQNFKFDQIFPLYESRNFVI